jgi:hypothetical protein
MRWQLVALSLFTCLQCNLQAHFYEQDDDLSVKVYIQPENVKLAGNRIYYVRDDQCFPVSNIHSDSSGLYTSLSREEQVRYTSYTCAGCGRIYSWWENCKTPGCPFGPKKPGNGS